MKLYFRVFALLFFVVQSKPLAYSQDSLVRVSELHFVSTFEKEAFLELMSKKNSAPLLPLLLGTSATSSNETVQQINNKIKAITDKLLADGLLKKKNEKKIKAIYTDVHNTFLKKYEEDVRFADIFTNGNYNCVTASALYALVFDALGISYEVKEEPTHVYLLAYPNSENILVESTSPVRGFIVFDERFKQNFVEALKNQKIIGNSEITNKSTDELFNSYYFKRDKLNLQQLVGIHYSNDAIFKRDKNDIKGAFQQMEKAYLLYQAPKTEYLLMQFGVEFITKEKLQPKEKSKLIVKVSRYKNQGITNEMIQGEFGNLTNEVLNRDNNKSLYRECFQILANGLEDKELVAEISYIYYFENGRIMYNQGSFSAAKVFFEKALIFQPNNTDLAGIFTTSIANSMRNERNSKQVYDTLDMYRKKYPVLSQNNNFNSMVAMSYALLFGEAYQKGNLAEAEKYKTLFEEMVKGNKDINIVPSIVGSAYSSACSYYFKKGQKTKAMQLLDKGLELDPDNFELRTRQQMINSRN